MARIRKFCAYRRTERPYTRRSKYREKSFIRVNPQKLIVKFNMGNSKKEFSHELNLVAKSDYQVRQNAMESARMVCNRFLEKNLGKNGYYLQVRPYPHHVLRENPLAAGAGADRMSTGMKKSFGRAIGSAARIKQGDILFHVKTNKRNLAVATTSLKRASSKLPNSYLIDVKELPKSE